MCGFVSIGCALIGYCCELNALFKNLIAVMRDCRWLLSTLVSHLLSIWKYCRWNISKWFGSLVGVNVCFWNLNEINGFMDNFGI